MSYSRWQKKSRLTSKPHLTATTCKHLSFFKIYLVHFNRLTSCQCFEVLSLCISNNMYYPLRKYNSSQHKRIEVVLKLSRTLYRAYAISLPLSFNNNEKIIFVLDSLLCTINLFFVVENVTIIKWIKNEGKNKTKDQLNLFQ